MEVWIVMDSYGNTDSDAIKGLFVNEEDAKIFIAEYVLNESSNTFYLELFKRDVIGKIE